MVTPAVFIGTVEEPVTPEMAPNLVARDELQGLLGYRPAVNLSRLPEWVDASSIHVAICNGTTPFTLGPTFGDDREYVAYWREDREPVIAWRDLPGGRWEGFAPGGVFKSTLGAAIDDSHNTLHLAFSTDGFCHAIGNAHSTWMKYCRTSAPNDLSTWVANTNVGGAGVLSAAGANEAAVFAAQERFTSYYHFVRMFDGTLLLIYRSGYSSSGHWCMNRYTPSGTPGVFGSWQRIGGTYFLLGIVQNLTNPYTFTSGDEQAYDWTMIPTEDGKLHTFWQWRYTEGPIRRTAVGAASNGVNTNTFIGAGVLNVLDASAFPSPGSVLVTTADSEPAYITYTGKTATSFTGCTLVSGGGVLRGYDRGGDIVERSADLSYACLTGLEGSGTPAAQKANGDSISTNLAVTPLRHSNIEIIHRAPFFVQSGGADVDHLGNPHCVAVMPDFSGEQQLEHVWWDGSSWEREFVTDHDGVPANLWMPQGCTVAAGSNGQTGTVATLLGGTGVLNVTSTLLFPDSGDIWIDGNVRLLCSYTGRTPTTFTGCTVRYGVGATLQTGDIVRFAHTGGGYSYPVPRANLVCMDERTYIICTSRMGGQRTGLWGIDCTPGEQPFEFPLLQHPVFDLEPQHNHRAHLERRELNMIAIPAPTDWWWGGGNRKEAPDWYGGVENWKPQVGLILSVNETQMPQVSSRACRVPKIEVIGTAEHVTDPDATNPSSTKFFTTTSAVAGGAPWVGRMMVPDDYIGHLVFARIKARMSVNSIDTTGELMIASVTATGRPQGHTVFQVTEMGMLRHFGNRFGPNGRSVMQTPWLPIKATVETPGWIANMNDSYILAWGRRSAGTGAATFDMIQVELGCFPDWPLNRRR